MSSTSIHRRLAAAVPAALFLFADASHLLAYSPCSPTLNACDGAAAVTTSHIQIGGARSRSSEGPYDPGRLSDGTIAEARYDVTFDRATGRLTLVATNTTATQATLTGIFFNMPPAVSGLQLLSHSGALPWVLAYDRDRADGVVDTNPYMLFLRGDGFGLFNVFLSNQGVDTWKYAGDPDTEILARGRQVTFVIQVTGDLSRITACSFTSIGSMIPPGDKIVIGLGRFQGGELGGVGYIGPCEGGDLIVSLARFDAEPLDSGARLRWDTASEIRNAGFAILRRDVRTQEVVRLNSVLIPGQGDQVAGASYEYLDLTAVNGKRYRYYLEDWDVDGVNTIHPPKDVVPNPARPSVRLLSPAYEEAAGEGVRFRWESDGRRRSVLEFSSEASFPAADTMVLRAGMRTARSLTGRELAEVRGMASVGEGGVYWRVIGRDARGRATVSETFFLVVEP